MPATSRRARLAHLRRQLIDRERWVDARLVVESHTGEELFRVGGRWDRLLHRYVDGPVKERHIQLEESQLESVRGFVRWLSGSRQNDPLRGIVLILGGARGSGKTWLLSLLIVAIALEWPDEWQYNVNLSTGQRREVLEGIREVIGADHDWIADESDDLRDPWLRFLTGSTLAFTSARNPKRLREAKLRIRAVHINEGQDQDEEIYFNGISATRNVDGLTTVATNRPRCEGGDWVSIASVSIQAGETAGEFHLLDPRKNKRVSRVALDKRAAAIRAVSAEAAAADTDPDAPMMLAGPIAYPAFKPLPLELGGHIGDPPDRDIGRWEEITRILSAAAIDGQLGYDFVCGVDFQRRPGIIGEIARLYRDDRGLVVLHIVDVVAVRGVEPDFSQALHAAGYRPNEHMGGPTVLLVGDATGARQNSEHKFAQPPSFTALRGDGWTVIPPMRHWRHGTPWNPLVKESRSQMHRLFDQHQILLSPKCKTPTEGFPSLVEAFRRAKVGPRGGLVEAGNFQHGPDGTRYLAWRFVPRPALPPPPTGINQSAFAAFGGIRITE